MQIPLPNIFAATEGFLLLTSGLVAAVLFLGYARTKGRVLALWSASFAALTLEQGMGCLATWSARGLEPTLSASLGLSFIRHGAGTLHILWLVLGVLELSLGKRISRSQMTRSMMLALLVSLSIVITTQSLSHDAQSLIRVGAIAVLSGTGFVLMATSIRRAKGFARGRVRDVLCVFAFLAGLAALARFVMESVLIQGAFAPSVLWTTSFSQIAVHLGLLVSICLWLLDQEREQAEHTTHTLRLREAELLQSQKMDTVGQVAGGMAHDFNNLLTVILGNVDILASRLAQEDVMSHSYLDEIRRGAEQASVLTGHILSFSRRQSDERIVLDVESMTLETEGILQRLIGEDVRLSMTSRLERPLVRVGKVHVQQILINLVVNARDAMPKGGFLGIELSNVTDDTGDFVELRVQDSGEGMDEEVLKRAFDPYFTTKRDGAGTGLGLATVHSLIKQNGGSIELHSAKGQGCLVVVRLPVAEGQQSGVDIPEAPPVHVPQAPSSETTVLVVEDESLVRRLATRCLREQGLHVLEAENGEEALSLSEQYEGPIDVILTDVIMPRLNGPQMVLRFLKSRPETRVMFMSGYLDRGPETLLASGIDAESLILLEKPFSPQDLYGCLERVLAEEVAVPV